MTDGTAASCSDVLSPRVNVLYIHEAATVETVEPFDV